MNLVRSELRKVLSTKTWLTFGIVAVVLVAGTTAISFFTEKVGTSNGAADLGLTLATPGGVQNLFSNVGNSLGWLFALLLGIVAMTSEFRFGTVVPTFLTTPQRERPVLAKMAAIGIISGAISLVVVVVSYALAFILLLTTTHAAINYANIVVIAFGAMLAYVLLGIAGVSIGALLRIQVLAVVLAVVWVVIVESIISALFTYLWHLGYIAKWFPTNAIGALVSVTNPRQTDQLPPWGGALTMLAYAALFAGLSFVTTLRRDVN